MEKGLVFEAKSHKYFFKGKPVPGVNEILRETGQAKDWKDTPEFYRERGEAVHKTIELWVKGTLDDTSVDPLVVPYLEQFKCWVRKEKVAGIPLTEIPFYSEDLQFAGRVDLIANQVIYDIKASKKLDKSAEWQYGCAGAAYRTLVKENMGLDLPFKVLLLSGEGEAKEIPMYSPYAAWEAVMSLYNIKMARTV